MRASARFRGVGANIDIHAQDFGICGAATCGVQLEHGGGKDQRAAVGDAGFDDQVWFYVPDDFLHGNHVLGVLDDGSAEPREMIGIFVDVGLAHPIAGGLREPIVSALDSNLLGTFTFELFA